MLNFSEQDSAPVDLPKRVQGGRLLQETLHATKYGARGKLAAEVERYSSWEADRVATEITRIMRDADVRDRFDVHLEIVIECARRGDARVLSAVAEAAGFDLVSIEAANPALEENPVRAASRYQLTECATVEKFLKAVEDGEVTAEELAGVIEEARNDRVALETILALARKLYARGQS